MAVLKFSLFVLISVQVILLKATYAEGPEVNVAEGRLLGEYGQDRIGRQYSQFLGIPYGHIPKRFDIPVPVKPWNGTKIVRDSGPGCVRMGLIIPGHAGVEDCLTLDVYTPQLPANNSNASLPVMMWITGGGFIDGEASVYGGKYFQEQDVVIVVINYRLGAFGFLNAGVPTARGNQGLKDMVLALKWIQRNIKAFSGNPNQVTIFGESAGGAAVSLLTISPMAKGLFHGAIIQSGAATCPYVLRSGTGVDHAKKLAAALDCPSSNKLYLVECLQRISPQEIAKLQTFVGEYGFNGDAIFMGPTLETSAPDDGNTFLTEDPYKLVQTGEFNKVPIIIGFVSNEFRGNVESTTKSPTKLKKLNSQFGRILPSAMLYDENAEDPSKVTEMLRMFYFNNSELTPESLGLLDIMMSDRGVVHCSRVMADAYSNFTDVYAYNYTKMEQGKASLLHHGSSDKEKDLQKRPATHADELPYLFEPKGSFSLIFKNVTKSIDSYEFSRNLISLWASFARDGKPGGLWGNSKPVWTKLSPGSRQKYLQIEEEPFMKETDEYFEASWKFWESLPLKEHGKSWSIEN